MAMLPEGCGWWREPGGASDVVEIASSACSSLLRLKHVKTCAEFILAREPF